MVVKLFNTDVAFEAVRSSRWSVNEASCAKLDPQVMCFYGHYKNILPVCDYPRQVGFADWNHPLLLFLEFLQDLGYNPRVPQPEHSHRDLRDYIQCSRHNQQR